MMVLPADFDWRARWPVATLLIVGRYGPGTVTEHSPTGPVILCHEPYQMGRGDWRLPPVEFADVTVSER